MLKNLCLKYFDEFSNKELDNIANMFDLKSNQIELKDWNVQKKGIADIKHVYSDIFKGYDEIRVIPLSLHQEDNIVCCQIRIEFIKRSIKDGASKKETTFLDVMDVITFNNYGYIQSIKAYKC